MTKEPAVLIVSTIAGLFHVGAALYGLYAITGSVRLRMVVFGSLIFIFAAAPVYLFLQYSLVLPFLFSLYLQLCVLNEIIFGYSMEPSIVLYFSPIIQLLLISAVAVVAILEYGIRLQLGVFPPSPLF